MRIKPSRILGVCGLLLVFLQGFLLFDAWMAGRTADFHVWLLFTIGLVMAIVGLEGYRELANGIRQPDSAFPDSGFHREPDKRGWRRWPHAPQAQIRHGATAPPAPAARGCRSCFRSTRVRRLLSARRRQRHPDPQSRCPGSPSTGAIPGR